jgi:hypothetical protein
MRGCREVPLRVEAKALARLANINIDKATQYVRRNPLFGDEIHIDDELVNLQEGLHHYFMAAHTLKQFPSLDKHTNDELRAILVHCVGLIGRMATGKPLPRSYTKDDTKQAIKELCRTLVSTVMRTGHVRHVDQEVIDILRPYMTITQRRYFEKTRSHVVAYWRMATRTPLFEANP